MDIAIIGIAGCLPEAQDLNRFYQNLVNGRDSIRTISDHRIRTTTLPEKDYQILGWIEGIDQFDYKFFALSRGEAETMDPHQRLSLQVAYQTFENAGYALERIKGSDTGVFIGDSHLNYYEHAEAYDANLLTGNLNAATAGRISRFFDLRGPALMIDTSCSSSLAALHLACNSIAAGESKMVLVCGVKLVLFPPTKINDFGEVGIESADGKVRSFSIDADGTGGGEGVVGVLLKPLENALADGDLIHAVIKGSAVNQDAALSASLTSPSSQAQAEVIKAAWRRAGIDPRTITYIEAHGTGTKLGDPIEVEALNRAFNEFTKDQSFCALSSVKSNIGHTDSAAGLVGLIKVVLALKFRKHFPAVNFRAANPFIPFQNSPVFVNTALRDWTVDEKAPVRRAGVSSFGLSGTNCHVVLQEAPESKKEKFKEQGLPKLVTLSAKSLTSLRSNSLVMSEFLREQTVDLDNFIFTLQQRGTFAYRKAFVASSASDLKSMLEKFSENGTADQIDEKTQFVFAFSETNSSLLNGIDAFSNLDADFMNICLECDHLLSPEVRNKLHIQNFIFQFAWGKLLQKRGMGCKNLIGHLVGDLVVSGLARPKLDQELVQRLNAFKPNEHTSMQQSILQLVQKIKKEKIVVVEMCPQSNLISSLLKAGLDPSAVVRFDLSQNAELTLLNFGKSLYEKGFQIDWKKFSESTYNKIELPPYQFETNQCWIKTVKTYSPDWFYKLDWQTSSIITSALDGKKICLVFVHAEFDISLLQILSGFHRVIIVRSSDIFSSLNEDHYTIDFSKREEYVHLFDELNSREVRPNVIIHLSGFQKQALSYEEDLRHGLYSQLFIVQAFDRWLSRQKSQFFGITLNARQWSEDEVSTNAINSTIHGFLNSFSVEYPEVRARAIDLDDQTSEMLGSILLSEIESAENITNVIYRRGIRYIPKIVKSNLKKSDHSTIEKSRGVVVVCGGSNGIGKVISEHLASQNYKIAVISRSIEQEARSSANIFYFKADIADKHELANALRQVTAKMGSIRGVINSAGVAGGKLIKDHSIESFSSSLKPKVMGTLNLLELVDGNLDFFITFSSIDSIIGATHNSNYSAANMFLDNVGTLIANKHPNCLSISWPGWSETGMLYRMVKSLNLDLPEDSITTKEGLTAFDLVLKFPTRSIIVSKEPPHRMGKNIFFTFNEVESVPLKSVELLPIETHQGVGSRSVFEFVESLWTSMLKMPDINSDDDFFEIGGQSLIGVQMVNRLKKEFHIDLDLDDLFEYATIKTLSDFIERKLKVVLPSTSPNALAPLELQEHYGLSHAQKRIWFVQQMALDNPAYNMFANFTIRGRLDRPAFEQAYEAIIRRHEALRTIFFLHNGDPRQKVIDYDRKRFPIKYLKTDSALRPEIEFSQLALEEAHIPFSLDESILIRTTVVESGANLHLVLFTIHHVICDGWSIGVLIKDFFELYTNASSTVPLPIQYKDYTGWQQKKISEGLFNSQRKYWIEKLKRCESRLNLATDYPRGSVLTFSGKYVTHSFNTNLSENIRNFCLQNDVTLFTALLALVKITLFKYCGEGVTSIGISHAGRHLPELEEQIGFYVNTLVISDILEKNDRAIDVINKVKRSMSEAQQNSIYPFDLLVQDLGVKREPNRNPLFDVEVNMLDDFSLGGEPITRNDISFEPFAEESLTSIFDASFNFQQAKDNLSLIVRYNTDLFVDETISAMIMRFEMILSAVLERPDRPIESLNITLAAEEAKRNYLQSTIGFEEAF